MATAPSNKMPPFAIPATYAELQSVLAAFQDATTGLEETYVTLHEEVRRLNEVVAEKNRELARKNRLADLGQVASHVAHEVRNNLVPLTLYLGMLKRRHRKDTECLGILDKIAIGVSDMDTLVNDLLHFATDREPNTRPTCVRSIITESIDRLSPHLNAHEIDVRLEGDCEDVVMLDSDMFRRVVLNLLINAIDAMPDGGRILVTARRGKQGVSLRFRDSGPGIPGEVLPRLFEPFFTTKGSGSGLGLAIAGHVVERHGGTLVAGNYTEGEASGAEFEVVLPTTANMAPGTAQQTTKAA